MTSIERQTDDSPQEAAAIADNLARVRARIAAAAREAGRDPATVRLLPVTKTVPAARIRHALAAGEHRFGENRVQEARAKTAELADTAVSWSVIGHLQTNKAKHIVRFTDEVQSLDRLRLAHALERRLQATGRALDVLVQVNTSDEASKYGPQPDAVGAFLQELTYCQALRVRGLMTLAMFSHDRERVRACFRRLRLLRDHLRQTAPAGVCLETLSMGMSGDYPIAIAEGATEVRVGQAIFGPRSTPSSHYWPAEFGQ